MRKVILGPFFCPARAPSGLSDRVAPLGLQLEWADSDAAAKIPLYRQRPIASGPLKLEQVLFAREDLPFNLECARYQLVQSEFALFLPMEALLAALYARFEIPRSIRRVLAELASVVPLHGPVRHPITATGLLAPQPESAGFRLNTVIRCGHHIYADIAWQVERHSTRFHACICTFERDQNGILTNGNWASGGIVDVGSLLTRELRRLVPGKPKNLFSPLGLTRLKVSTLSGNIPAGEIHAKQECT